MESFRNSKYHNGISRETPDRKHTSAWLFLHPFNHNTYIRLEYIRHTQTAVSHCLPTTRRRVVDPAAERGRARREQPPSSMTTEPTEDPQSTAVEQLEQFGLSAYAARTFVALAGLGIGTARDVSQVSEVPRTRVYDAIDELRGRGLVDVKQSSPKQFWAISAESASRTFEHELRHRTDILRTALSELEPVERQETQRGVWTVDGQPAVTERVLQFFGNAEEEIVYMTVEELLTDDLIDALSDAAERGVSIELGGVSGSVQERIQDDVPGVTTFESLWVWSDTPAARLMMVDGEKTLVSALVNGVDANPSDPRSETAIWGEGETNSLVAVLKAIFTWRLETVDPDS